MDNYQPYGFNNYNNPYAFQPQQPTIPPLLPYTGVDNSRVWFAAFVPLLAIFIEIFANTFTLGVLVWVCAAASAIIACINDRRYLKNAGVDVSRISPFLAFIPPIYMMVRKKQTYQANSISVIFIAAFIYALLFNGFTKGLMMDEDDMISQAADNYVQNMAQVSGYDGYNMIYSQLTGYCEELFPNATKFQWSAEKIGDEVQVTAENNRMTAVFIIPFDGYAFGDITVTSIVVDGEEYNEDDPDKLNEIVKEIFVNTDVSGNTTGEN